MYAVFRTRGFERSYKRIERSGKLKQKAKKSLVEAIDTLARGEKLPPQYKDHQLSGELKRYRECHIKGDLLLVYQVRRNELVLMLVDLGSHSYLGF
jgi:mRNA interferase YafQ